MHAEFAERLSQILATRPPNDGRDMLVTVVFVVWALVNILIGVVR